MLHRKHEFEIKNQNYSHVFRGEAEAEEEEAIREIPNSFGQITCWNGMQTEIEPPFSSARKEDVLVPHIRINS